VQSLKQSVQKIPTPYCNLMAIGGYLFRHNQSIKQHDQVSMVFPGKSQNVRISHTNFFMLARENSSPDFKTQKINN